MNLFRSLRHLTRPLRHHLAYIILQGISLCVHHLPLMFIQQLGRFLGRLTGFLSPPLNHLINDHLSRLNTPYVPSSSACWADLGQRTLEWLKGREALGLMWISPLDLQLLKHTHDTAQKGQAWVCLSAHIGHWELMAAFLAEHKLSFHAVAAASKSGPLGSWLKNYRKKLGVMVSAPQGGARLISRSLQRGGVVAFLIDQSTGERSRLLSFLGELAPTSFTATRLIKAYQARTLWIYSLRGEDGRYQIFVSEIIDPDPVAWATHALEVLVHDHPTQWVWLHKRWELHPRGSLKRERDEPQSEDTLSKNI